MSYKNWEKINPKNWLAGGAHGKVRMNNKNWVIQIKLNTTQITLIFCIVICENDLEQRVVKQLKEM